VSGLGIVVAGLGGLLAAAVCRATGAGWGAALALGAVLGVGLYLWTADAKKSLGDLGAGIFVSVVVAIALMAVQRDADKRQRSADASRQRNADRQNLLLTITLQRKLTGVSLAGRDLTAAFLPGRDFRQSDLRRARFTNATLSSAKLGAVVAIGAHFDGAQMAFADLQTGTTDARSLFGSASFRKAVLTGAQLQGGSFVRADFSDADLRGANLYGADLTGAVLVNARMQGADLNFAMLTGANLVGARLEAFRGDIQLRAVDGLRYGPHGGATTMCGANLTGAALVDAVYDENTRWPAGFNPERHGAEHPAGRWLTWPARATHQVTPETETSRSPRERIRSRAGDAPECKE
jgi:uncharacterized protein YjbI with pentapeptide repeats